MAVGSLRGAEMQKTIVTTTINPPTEALRRFSRLNDWDLVVIGDLKTPEEWHLDRAVYVSPREQELRFPALSASLGWNCIQRRNIGFAIALEMKSDLIATVDDDNVPYEFWDEASHHLLGTRVSVPNYFISNSGIFDPLSVTNYPQLWHRGFPIQLLRQRESKNLGPRAETFHVQAGFWNGDPDIDAICRMEHAPDCTFEDKFFPFASSSWAPFNSQNTVLTNEALRHYFMFPGVGRMDDIWASYYLQSLGYRVVFTKASVEQKRNLHDLTKDFIGEISGYTHNLRLIEDLHSDPENIQNYLPGESWTAFRLYRDLVDKF